MNWELINQEYERAKDRAVNFHGEARKLTDMSASRLVTVVKTIPTCAQDAAVVLLHDFFSRDNLAQHFSPAEIDQHFARYFSQRGTA